MLIPLSTCLMGEVQGSVWMGEWINKQVTGRLNHQIYTCMSMPMYMYEHLTKGPRMEVCFHKISHLFSLTQYPGNVKLIQLLWGTQEALQWKHGPSQKYMWLAKGARGIFRVTGSQNGSWEGKDSEENGWSPKTLRERTGIHLLVNMPMTHTGVSEFESQLQLLNPAPHQCRLLEAEVTVQVIRFLPPTLET